ncbi:MAG: 30S ribosomal protein S3 [Desulfurococcaceae archaeon]
MTGSKVREYFINYGVIKSMIDEFLASYFYKAGYAGLDLYKTPTGYRLVLYVEYPGMVIGPGGSTIRKLSLLLQRRFGLENPNITVLPVGNPDLNARIIAFRIVRALEKEIPYRRVAIVMINRAMAAGAIGVEIVISGKLRAERATYLKLRAGKVYKAGEQADYLIDRAVAKALLKPGVYGVEVIVVKPGITSDHVSVREVKPEELDKFKVEVEEGFVEQISEREASEGEAVGESIEGS